mmetsp:Transcript_7788/g.16924  ORF Transcript_7788/g.16924 Transcript_7788/m.16924 type:complete len:288 (+) Transcript_7788:1992-2855(+)
MRWGGRGRSREVAPPFSGGGGGTMRTDIPGRAMLGQVTVSCCPLIVTGNCCPPRIFSGILTMYAGCSPGANSWLGIFVTFSESGGSSGSFGPPPPPGPPPPAPSPPSTESTGTVICKLCPGRESRGHLTLTMRPPAKTWNSSPGRTLFGTGTRKVAIPPPTLTAPGPLGLAPDLAAALAAASPFRVLLEVESAWATPVAELSDLLFDRRSDFSLSFSFLSFRELPFLPLRELVEPLLSCLEALSELDAFRPQPNFNLSIVDFDVVFCIFNPLPHLCSIRAERGGLWR